MSGSSQAGHCSRRRLSALNCFTPRPLIRYAGSVETSEGPPVRHKMAALQACLGLPREGESPSSGPVTVALGGEPARLQTKHPSPSH